MATDDATPPPPNDAALPPDEIIPPSALPTTSSLGGAASGQQSVDLRSADARRSAVMGRWCVIGAAVLWSLNGLFAKNDVFDSWPDELRGTLLAFWRNVFAGLAILPFVRRPQWQASLVPMVVCFTLLTVTFLQSMTRTTAANAIWLQSIAPLWVFAIGRVFGGDAWDRRDLAPLLLGGAGVGTILAFELPAANGPPIGVLLGLLSGLFYAIIVVLLRHLRSLNAAWIVAVNHLGAALLLFPYVIAQDVWPRGMQWPVVVAFGVVQMALPYLLFTYGLRSISSQEGSGLSLLEPVLVPVWVYAAYSEAPAPWTIVGGALILLGLLSRYAIRPRAELS